LLCQHDDARNVSLRRRLLDGLLSEAYGRYHTGNSIDQYRVACPGTTTRASM